MTCGSGKASPLSEATPVTVVVVGAGAGALRCVAGCAAGVVVAGCALLVLPVE